MEDMGKRAGSPKIADLPFSERPLEKLKSNGPAALSDADLLAVILRSGHQGGNALDLAYRILSGQSKQGLGALGAVSGREFLRLADAEELASFKGIGHVKAHQIIAAVELGRRVHGEPIQDRPLLNAPELVWAFLRDDMGDCAQEEMRLLLLDVKNRLIRMETVSKGGLSAMVIQPREIMRLAVRANAAAIIMVHNHPSGDPKPSQHDIDSTQKIREAAALIGIPLQDHIIICKDQFTSLVRNGF